MQKLQSEGGSILRYLVSLAAIAVLLTAPAVFAGPSLTVRVVNLADLAPHHLDEALAVAADGYERVGITIRWTMCGRCKETPKPGDLWLRIAPDSKRLDLQLGVSAIDPDTGAGVVATVYPGAIQKLAVDAGGSFARLFGTVIAHEVGHLVLGSNRHADRGVMQRGWSLSEVRILPAPSFTNGEGLALRERLEERLSGN